MKEQKNISIRLVGVTYSGPSIGDDIRISIQALGSTVSFDRKIKKNTKVVFNEVVGQMLVETKSTSLPIIIKIVELDAMYNDVGHLATKLSYNSEIASLQKSIHRIIVRESRGAILPSGKEAQFDVALELIIEPLAHLIEKDSEWVRVLVDSKRKQEPLPSGTKVQITKRTNTREYFSILEGALMGKSASVKYKDSGSSYLTDVTLDTKGVAVTYSISKRILTIQNKKYTTKDYPGYPWKKGLYDIEIPDYPHGGGQNYVTEAPHARTWFRIGHTGDRYLHTGSVSLGCITVIEHTRWEEIYQALIFARKGDGVSVGVLKVID